MSVYTCGGTRRPSRVLRISAKIGHRASFLVLRWTAACAQKWIIYLNSSFAALEPFCCSKKIIFAADIYLKTLFKAPFLLWGASPSQTFLAADHISSPLPHSLGFSISGLLRWRAWQLFWSPIPLRLFRVCWFCIATTYRIFPPERGFTFYRLPVRSFATLGSVLAMIEIFFGAVDLSEDAKPPWQIVLVMSAFIYRIQEPQKLLPT